MTYLLFINTPDSTEEICAEHNTIDSMQIAKDVIYSLPWLTTDGLDVYASDSDGNEVYLK